MSAVPSVGWDRLDQFMGWMGSLNSPVGGNERAVEALGEGEVQAVVEGEGNPKPSRMKFSQSDVGEVMTAPTPSCEKNQDSAWPDGRWISPSEDTPAAFLYVVGLALISVGLWFHGRLGIGFTGSPPDYGGEWWLIVALLGLVSLCGFSYVNRRLRSRGLDTPQVWGVVRALHDAEARSYERRQVIRGSVVFGLLGGLLAIAVLGLAFAFDFDQWIDSGYGNALTPAAASIGGVFGGYWIRRRVAAKYPYGHVPYDWVALVATLMSALLAMATIWIAGRTGVPTERGAELSVGLHLLVFSVGLVSFFASVLRLRFLSRPESGEISVGEPS